MSVSELEKELPFKFYVLFETEHIELPSRKVSINENNSYLTYYNILEFLSVTRRKLSQFKNCILRRCSYGKYVCIILSKRVCIC